MTAKSPNSMRGQIDGPLTDRERDIVKAVEDAIKILLRGKAKRVKTPEARRALEGAVDEILDGRWYCYSKLPPSGG